MIFLAFTAHRNDPLSEIIMAETRSSFCHGARLVDDTEEQAWAIETFALKPIDTPHLLAEEYYPCARYRFLEKAELPGIQVFTLTDAAAAMFDEQKAIAWAKSMVVKKLPYDAIDLFRFPAFLRALLGEAPEDAWKRHQFCSEFVFETILNGGVRLLNCAPAEFSPNYLDWSPYTRQLPQLI
jgi:hypothetical protein